MSKLPEGEAARWLDSKANIDKVFYALVAGCVVVTVADLAYDKHGHFGFENWFGFHAGFGFLAYVGLVTLAKGLRRLLKRDEKYWEDADGVRGEAGLPYSGQAQGQGQGQGEGEGEGGDA